MKNNTCKKIAKRAVNEWFGYQNPAELELALRVVKDKQPKVILEIGMAHGASLASWCKVSNPDIAIGMDPLTIPKTPEQQISFDKLVAENNIKMIPWISRLPVAHEILKEFLDGRKIDFLFIDGNHGYNDAQHDFSQYKKYLASDALVGFHDIYYSDTLVDAGSTCCLFWNRMKRDYSGQYEFHYDSSMGIGIIKLDSYNWDKKK